MCSVVWLVAAIGACSDPADAGTKTDAAATGGAPPDAAGGTGGHASGGAGGSTMSMTMSNGTLDGGAHDADVADPGREDSGRPDAGASDAGASDAGATHTGTVVCGPEKCPAGQLCCIHGITFAQRACTAPADCKAGLRTTCESSHDCGAGTCCLSGMLKYDFVSAVGAPLDAGIACTDACGPDETHAPIACAGAGDCADGELCCSVVDPSAARLLRTECGARCDDIGTPLCRTAADCPADLPRCDDMRVGTSTGQRLCQP